MWLKPHLPKGRLAKDVSLHLAEQGAGFLSSGGKTCQKKLFLGLTDVLWQITPALKNSLSRDLASLGGDMREG